MFYVRVYIIFFILTLEQNINRENNKVMKKCILYKQGTCEIIIIEM